MKPMYSRRRKTFAFVGSLLLFAVAVHTASATNPVVLVTNTNQPVFPSIPVVYAGQWLAAPFGTGPAAAQFDSVTLLEDNQFSHSGSFWVTLYSDNSGQPGSPLTGGLLNGPSQPSGQSFVTYSASPSLILSANTEYWVVAASDDPSFNGGYGWNYVNSTDFTSSYGWTMPGYSAYTPNGGTNWVSGANTPDLNPLDMAINGAIIPEPISMLLIPLGFTMLLLSHRPRGRRQ